MPVNWRLGYTGVPARSKQFLGFSLVAKNPTRIALARSPFCGHFRKTFPVARNYPFRPLWFILIYWQSNQGLAVVPGHPLRWRGGQVLGVFL
jgi:hypothetical protein